MSHEYKVIDLKKPTLENGKANPRSFTFTIDGHETHYYSPTEHGIRRVMERVQKGRLLPGGMSTRGGR